MKVKVFSLSEIDWEIYHCYGEFIHPDRNKTNEDFRNDVKKLIQLHFDEWVNKHLETNRTLWGPDLLEFIVDKIPSLGYMNLNELYEYSDNSIRSYEVEQEETQSLFHLSEEQLKKVEACNKIIDERFNSEDPPL